MKGLRAKLDEAHEQNSRALQDLLDAIQVNGACQCENDRPRPAHAMLREIADKTKPPEVES